MQLSLQYDWKSQIRKSNFKNGEDGINFEIVSIRNNKLIPLKYESEGIKRLISVISSMIAAFNNYSICLMIDEFDSGIFEYLLGELVEIIDESAKGQFVFTSHNLRALENYHINLLSLLLLIQIIVIFN